MATNSSLVTFDVPPVSGVHASQVEDLQRLQKAAQKINSILDLDQLIENIVNDVARSFGCVEASIYLHDEDRREMVILRGRIMRNTPSLQARSLVHQKAWEDAMQEMVAARLHVDPDVDLRPGVVSATTLAALRVAFTNWLTAGATGDLIAMTAEALDLLDGGLQQVHYPS